MKFRDLALDFRIYSTPAVWRTPPSGGRVISLVAGQVGADGREDIDVVAVDEGGRRVHGFPSLRDLGRRIAPAHQLATAPWREDRTEALLAIDLDGAILEFHESGKAPLVVSTKCPVHGLLVWPPLVGPRDDASAGALLLVGQRFTIRPELRDAVNLIDRAGESLPGYPYFLDDTPIQHAPVLTGDGRVFVLLRSGRVDGLELRGGRRIPGFPSSPPPEGLVDDRAHLAYVPAFGALVLSTGGDAMIRIDAGTGRCTPLPGPPGARLTGLAGSDERLYAIDEASSRLLCVDRHGAIDASLALGWPSGSQCYYIGHHALAHARGRRGACLILVSRSHVDGAVAIEHLFNTRATPDVRSKIERLADDERRRVYGVGELRPEQQAEMDHSVMMMKKSFLRNVMGSVALNEQLSGVMSTRVQAVTDEGGRMKVVLDDVIDGCTPDTGLDIAGMACPVLCAGSRKDSLDLFVPLNDARPVPPGRPFRSRLRIYPLAVGAG